MGRSQSATFKFWDNFMDSAHIMLRLLRAERDAAFDLHPDAVKYPPVYVAEMRQLETQKPDVFLLTRLWNRQSTVRPKAMGVSLALHCEKWHYCDGFSPDMSLVSMQMQWRLCAPQHLDQTSTKSLAVR